MRYCGVIRQACKELGIEVIDMAVNCDHVHLFIQYPPKYPICDIAYGCQVAIREV